MRCVAKGLSACAVFIFSLAACQPAAAPVPTPEPQKIGVTPLYLEWIMDSLSTYRKSHPGSNFVLDIYTIRTGLSAVEEEQLDLFVGAVEPDENLVTIPLFKDGITVIHSLDLDLSGLSLDELRHVFSGRYQNWDELTEEDQPIHPLLPPPGEDLRTIFQQAVMGSFKFSTLARLEASPEDTIKLVMESPGAIGLIPFSRLTEDVGVFQIEGQTPSERSIFSGRYQLSYWVVAIAAGEPDGAVRDWLSWVQAQN